MAFFDKLGKFAVGLTQGAAQSLPGGIQLGQQRAAIKQRRTDQQTDAQVKSLRRTAELDPERALQQAQSQNKNGQFDFLIEELTAQSQTQAQQRQQNFDAAASQAETAQRQAQVAAQLGENPIDIQQAIGTVGAAQQQLTQARSAFGEQPLSPEIEQRLTQATTGLQGVGQQLAQAPQAILDKRQREKAEAEAALQRERSERINFNLLENSTRNTTITPEDEKNIRALATGAGLNEDQIQAFVARHRRQVRANAMDQARQISQENPGMAAKLLAEVGGDPHAIDFFGFLAQEQDADSIKGQIQSLARAGSHEEAAQLAETELGDQMMATNLRAMGQAAQLADEKQFKANRIRIKENIVASYATNPPKLADGTRIPLEEVLAGLDASFRMIDRAEGVQPTKPQGKLSVDAAVQSYAEALDSGQLSPEEVEQFISVLDEYTEEEKRKILDTLKQVKSNLFGAQAPAGDDDTPAFLRVGADDNPVRQAVEGIGAAATRQFPNRPQFNVTPANR